MQYILLDAAVRCFVVICIYTNMNAGGQSKYSFLQFEMASL